MGRKRISDSSAGRTRRPASPCGSFRWPCGFFRYRHRGDWSPQVRWGSRRGV